jgi:hypothetical protein
MVLAGSAGVYEVTASAGGSFWTVELIETRGKAEGESVPVGSKFGQAGPL